MLRIFAVFLTAALVAGCASIIHGSRQDIRVLSNPSGAIVRVNLSNTATTTPGVLNLNRKETAYVLTFEKDGHKPIEVSLRRTVDGWVFGNILFGGLVGIIIDFASGSAYKLTPSDVEVVLNRMGASSKDYKNGDMLVFVDMEKLPENVRSEIIRKDKAA